MNDQSGLPPRSHNLPDDEMMLPVLPGEATPEQIARAQEAAKAPEKIEGLQPYDPAKHAELQAHVQVFCDAAGKWLDIKTVQNTEQAERLTDFITGARALHKRVEDSRKAEKKPWDDLGKKVQDAYKPMTGPPDKQGKNAGALVLIGMRMDQMQKDWLRREDARIAAEKREAEAKARAAREAAEKAAAEAAARNDISGQVEAEEALKAAQKQEKAASKPVKAQAGSATGAGRTMALRTVRTAEIVNRKAALLYWMNDPALIAELQRIANAAVRSGEITEDQAILAGIKIKTEKV